MCVPPNEEGCRSHMRKRRREEAGGEGSAIAWSRCLRRRHHCSHTPATVLSSFLQTNDSSSVLTYAPHAFTMSTTTTETTHDAPAVRVRTAPLLPHAGPLSPFVAAATIINSAHAVQAPARVDTSADEPTAAAAAAVATEDEDAYYRRLDAEARAELRRSSEASTAASGDEAAKGSLNDDDDDDDDDDSIARGMPAKRSGSRRLNVDDVCESPHFPPHFTFD